MNFEEYKHLASALSQYTLDPKNEAKFKGDEPFDFQFGADLLKIGPFIKGGECQDFWYENPVYWQADPKDEYAIIMQGEDWDSWGACYTDLNGYGFRDYGNNFMVAKIVERKPVFGEFEYVDGPPRNRW